MTLRDAAAIQELRASILKRPGMYFGDASYWGGLTGLLAWMATEAVQNGAAAVSCHIRSDNRICFSVVSTVASAEALTSPEQPTGGPIALSAWQLAIAISKHVEHEESGSRLSATFEPDFDAFPFLGPVSPYPLVGVFSDLATAYPQHRFEAVDEREGLRLALQFARGCEDRLYIERGDRGVRRPLRFEGKRGDVAYDVALGWCPGPGLQVVSLVNGARSANGGSHVQGVWEGVASALNQRLRAEGIASRDLDLMDIPRNAVLVVSVHLDDPSFGPATKDCLHDERVRLAVRDAVAKDFFAKLDDDAIHSSKPPWQLMSGMHYDIPWLERLPSQLSNECRPGDRDPFHHHPEDHC